MLRRRPPSPTVVRGTHPSKRRVRQPRFVMVPTVKVPVENYRLPGSGENNGASHVRPRFMPPPVYALPVYATKIKCKTEFSEGCQGLRTENRPGSVVLHDP